jgi:hypothetical protein
VQQGPSGSGHAAWQIRSESCSKSSRVLRIESGKDRRRTLAATLMRRVGVPIIFQTLQRAACSAPARKRYGTPLTLPFCNRIMVLVLHGGQRIMEHEQVRATSATAAAVHEADCKPDSVEKTSGVRRAEGSHRTAGPQLHWNQLQWIFGWCHGGSKKCCRVTAQKLCCPIPLPLPFAPTASLPSKLKGHSCNRITPTPRI